MAQRITMDIADDGSTSVSVEMDGAEPQMMEFDSADEALNAVYELVSPEGVEATPEAMWDEEAAMRDEMMATEEMM